MKKLLTPLVLLAALAAILAGCGGGGGSKASSTPTSGGGVNGISVGNCLNEQDDFLVQPSEVVLTGMSPAGVAFSLKFYATPAAATAAAKKKNAKTTAVVENAVIDFKGNPSPYVGAPPAKISAVELKNIKDCIDSSRS
jgi:hypothetical protein